MSVSFASSDGSIDIASVTAFLEAVAAPDVLATLSALNPDPTDVLSVAEIARLKGRREHALGLYQWALERLERDPSAMAADTNLSGAYYFTGKTMLELRRPADAIAPLMRSTALRPTDAIAWHMLGIATGLAGDLDEAVKCLDRALQLDGIDPNQDAQFFANVRDTLTSTTRERLRRELEQAPETFRRGFGLMGKAWAAAARQMADVVGEWAPAARCCQAYCLRQLERYEESLAALQEISAVGVRPVWQWYFHHTVAHSRNMVDDLAGALHACDAAIEHFRNAGSSDDVASFLALKANVLKQQAFRLSTDPDTIEQARPVVVAALECFAQSIALLPPDGEELDEELDGIARIAARVHVDNRAFTLPGMAPRLKAMFDNRFSPLAQQRSRALQVFNRGADAFNQRRYEDAASLLQHAFAAMPASEPNDAAFRALIAYQRGLALLRSAGIEKVVPQAMPADKLPVAQEIRAVWNDALMILADLPEEVARHFNEQLAPGATAAMVNDPLLRGAIVHSRGLDLANQGQKAEAARCFVEALELLDPRVPEHEPLIAQAHLRSASLLSDIGKRAEAAAHAGWVLEHQPPDNVTVRTAMEVIAGQRTDTAQRSPKARSGFFRRLLGGSSAQE